VRPPPKEERLSSEQIYRLIVEASPNAIVLATAEGRILLVNAATESLFGYPRAELVGQPVEMLVPERFRHSHPGHCQSNEAPAEAQPTGKFSDHFARRKDGSEVPVEIGITQIPTSDGPLVLSVIVDITERKRTEEHVQWLESFPEQTPNSVIEFDPATGAIYYTNPGAKKLLPDLDKLGPRHPMLSNLEESQETLLGGWADSVQREVVFGKRCFGQTISRVPNTRRLRIYSLDVTERKRAEESQMLLAAIVNSSDDAIISKTLDGVITSWNPGAERLFGYAAREAIGQSMLMLFSPERAEEEAKILARIRQGESVEHFDTERICKDGRKIDVSVTISPIADEHGRIIGASKIARDVSERKQVERLLQQSEGEFRTLAEAMPQMVWVTRADGANIYFNRRWTEYTGLTLEESLGDGWNKPFHPDDQQRAWDAWQQAVTGTSNYSLECRLRGADGNYRWWWILGAPHRSADGAILKWFGTCSDITERKQAEEAMRKSEERYRTTLENMMEGCQLISFDWRYLYLNKAASVHNRRPNEELLGRTVLEAWPGIEASAVYALLARCMAERVAVHEEAEFVFPHGGAGWFDIRCQPIPEGIFVLSIDVTERKRAEAKLQESEQSFRTMANSISQLAWIARPDGFIHWFNQRWYDYTGTIPEQMEGWGWQSVHDPELLPQVMERWTAAIAAGEVFEMEHPLRRADGQFRRFLTRARPLKDAEGRVAQWFGTNTDVQELKHVEEALRETQARLNSTLAAGSIGTWTWDIVNDRLAADEFTARMFSIEKEAAAEGLPAEAYLQAVLEEDQAGVAAGLARAIESCGHYDIEYRVRQKVGDLRWVQAKGRVDCDAAGHAVSFHGAVMDITERKRTEGRFRRLVDSNVQGVIFWNTKGEITRANDAFLRMVGASREDLEAGRVGWADMTPPQYADLDRRSLDELAAKGVCTPFEKEYLRKDGSRVPVLIGAARFEDSPEEGVCFVVDITERKRGEAALREREEQLLLYAEHSPAAIAMFDRDMKYLVVSRRWTEVFRLGNASVIGRSHYDVFPDLPERWKDIHERCLAGAVEKCDEDEYVRADGTIDWVRWEIRPWRQWDGAIGGIIVFTEDITERKRANEQIRLLNEDLERRVIDRTAQLETANKELEAFSYSVSHDLRAPLRAVNGFAQMAVEDFGAQLPLEGQHCLHTICDAAQRMGALIDDLLTFSRLSRAPLNRRTVATDSLVRGILADTAAERVGRTIEIRIGELPPCSGDSALLKQVWINLLSNACKYTKQRAIAEIEIGSNRENDETIYFVRDNGAGFDMRYVGKLFGVFQRLHRMEDYEGTGVGLATVQRIIHRHGGRIWAEAAVERGATFYFTLQETTS
jgi:PAS domain S-box-containing protein